ncbi:glycosyltransferase family 1 protein [Jeotgalibacillus sp. S-D1]|uniref:glycosyltransferase family 4 protein n=1 Tax=Jeotgalibacillus sp. S-D1 TaxID=2552189 RepID=UPI00105A0EDB|nr:glycosyltransferase family 4 protein [Jeotgalibacillus sp. S-D1]TDL32841.1 glycosyltransferase family 1 protein [Jeotgalibacillus sp. S-D1]
MKFILISPKNRTVYNFRGDLIKDIISNGYEVIVTGPNLDNIDKITELGARFEQIPLDKTGLNVVADIKYLFNLIKLFKREKPDVTFGYTIKPVIYGSIAAKLAGVNNINSMVTGVGYVFTATTRKARIIKFFASILYRLGFSCADTVIFQNKDDLHEFTELGLLNKGKCQLIDGSGVNMEKFLAAEFPKQLTFFMLSRVMYSKGIREYLEAAREIKSNNKNVRFMLLGAIENMQDSMSKEDLETYIDDGTIEHYGETNDVLSYYKMSSVYVLPSYREGTPRTVLEAMAVGRPIITTDAPGCRETVIDGKNGFLIAPKSTDQLVEKMQLFIKNPNLIKQMGDSSYELCKKKYDVKKVNKKMLSFLKISNEGVN